MATDSKGYAAGIVIGEDAITIVEMNVGRGNSEITARGSVETPPGAVDGAAVVDPARVANAIKSLRRDMGMRATMVTVAMDSPGYSMRTVRLPDVPVREQRMLVRGELEQVGALPVGTGAFDHIWLPAPSSEGRKQADAAAYYTSDANVDSIRGALRQAGLQLGGIEPASIAMMRAAITGLEERRPVALLYVSSKHSDLLIHDGDLVRHVRRIPAGWDEIARPEPTGGPIVADSPDLPMRPSAASMEGSPYATAVEEDQDPLATALPAYARSADPTSLRPDQGNGLQASSSVPFLAAEVGRSLAFYAREYGTAPQPETLVVLGIHAGTEEVRTILRDYLTIPVDTRRVMEAYPMPPATGRVGYHTDESTTLAALGAAFSDAEAAIPAVDISKQESIVAARKRAPTVLLAGMAASTVWMLAAIGASVTLTYLESKADEQVARIDNEIKRIKDERAPKLRKYAIVQAAKAASDKSRIPASSILGRIAAATTPGVGVTSIKLEPDGKLQVNGEATSTMVMELFAQQLSQGIAIKTPFFQQFKKGAKEGITFQIVGYYRGSGGEGK